MLLMLAFVLLCPVGLYAADNQTDFSQAELDQMMAPVALYPDSLLSQILMASTYPAEVAEAVQWSKAHPDKEGDAAVSAVQDKSWDPSVLSLVAFPQVLDMMGKEPEWVQNMGDAFLASPDAVMDTVQTLRNKAKDEGNLETTKEQTVTVEQADTQQIIIIEPADPATVYVPVYNPTIVYGTWWWPSYRPYYYYPPGYTFGSALVAGIGFGVGIAITNSLWGNCNWRNRDIDINVNRFNNINVNRRLDVNRNSVSWKHNAVNRRGVPYRDKGTRNKYTRQRSGTKEREAYRGRDAERQRAQQALKERGVDATDARQKLSGKSGDRVRSQVDKIDRSQAREKLTARDTSPGKDRLRESGRADTLKSSYKNRDAGRQRDSHSSKRAKSNALSGIRKPESTNRNINRGLSSRNSMGGQRGGGGFGGGRGGGGGGLRGR